MPAPGFFKDILASWGMGEIHPHNLTEASFPPNAITELKHSGELWGDAVHPLSWGLVFLVLVTYKPEVIIAATALSSCIALWGHKDTLVCGYIFINLSHSRNLVELLTLQSDG